MKSELEKIAAGELYRVNDELNALMAQSRQICKEYNETNENETEKRKAILQKLLGTCPENITILPDMHFDYGSHTHIGDNFFANYGMIVLDVGKVTIGRDVMFGPRVSLFAAGHPTDVEVRRELLEYGYSITIGDDVWIGGNTVVNPGVTIGSGTVIGSGSVVTKDIPAGVVAAGNPCRVIRVLDEKDREYWHAQRRVWQES